MDNSNYKILNLVGEGQFGKVYTAIHRQTGELVALKELNPRKFSTKKFLREMRILLSLEHPNIVTCKGIEHNSKGRYLVTEYCEGGTLRDLLETSIELSLEQKLKIITDILEGLNQAHIEGIIHRDLKPENILLCVTSGGWKAKISDFGVAKIELEDVNVSSNIGDTGSPAYMAPEQFYGKYSYSSDLYAIGIMLYEILIGYRPFSGSPNEIMIQHLNLAPKIPPEIPESLAQILKEALQKLPQHRFRTAQEMKTAILRATLELQVYNQSLYSTIPYQSISLNLVYQESIQEPINYVAVKDNFLYLATKKSLLIQSYDHLSNNIEIKDIIKHQFDDKIIEIKSVEDGCIVVTQNPNNYYQYSFFHCGNQKTNLREIKSESFAYAIPNNYSWIALNNTFDNEQGFQIINTKNGNVILNLVKDFLPKQILSLDNNHGVAIYDQLEIDKNQTFLRFFNRRGNWYDAYIISLSLHSLVYHQKVTNTFLTREKQTNNLILINLYPFAIRRIPLNFKADFWICRDNGFICASHQGNIALLDTKGDYLGETNLNLSISSIESLKDDKILVIVNTENGQEKRIYH
ncbi:serine/threonine-protein kinase [Geminocystis sp. CENA526]|uniref:serine/threonine-protein kinase n=1 Tax=Geminocystis sp. CENA526 TaxID=1355871 RepID=UPI003D6E8F79